MQTKQCNRCCTTKTVDLFTKQKNKSGTTGYSSNCKECKKILMQEYRKTPKSIQQRKEHYQKNRQRLIEVATQRKNRKDYRFNNIFCAMKRRCENNKSSNFIYYGGRGIRVMWKSYSEFKKDMYEPYKKHVVIFGERNTTIDRIDVNGNYCKSNCRWATWKEQQHNKRAT